jgi:hypothetical protein
MTNHCFVKMHELQMWCLVPLPERELHRRKLRSDKYKPPAVRWRVMNQICRWRPTRTPVMRLDVGTPERPRTLVVLRRCVAGRPGRRWGSIHLSLLLLRSRPQRRRRERGGRHPLRPSEVILSEFQSPSRRIFIGSHSLPPPSLVALSVLQRGGGGGEREG